jgi:putative acetyltransferase
MQIDFEDPATPDARRLVAALDAYQQPLYPPESHHGLDLAALSQPHVLFALARDDDGQALGCGALVLHEAYGEFKRMYVDPAARGRGVGVALLEFLEGAAAERGYTELRLETGISQPEALRLYTRAGYQRCGPFGAYGPDPLSVFMVKTVHP